MGAKAPEKLKLRRPPIKCDVCGRKFLNATALTSHRKFMHKTKTIPPKRLPIKPQAEVKSKKVVKSKISNPPPVKKPIQKLSPKIANKVTKVSAKTVPKVMKEEPKEKIVKKHVVVQKVQFKCPKCVKCFTINFSAFRHIQKHHCVDKNGQPVDPNSPDIIKPIRIDHCMFCKNWIPYNEVHNCKSIMDHVNDRYMCLGCQQTFESLTLFEHHVKGTHGEGAQSFFFPLSDDLTTWKIDLESVTKTKFVMLNTKQKSKQVLHCAYQPSMEIEKTLMCPSSIFITEFKTGYQVFYYKEHFGHKNKDLPMEKYKRFMINPVVNTENEAIRETDNDIYQQFKNVMRSITINAAKVDIGVLNTLLGKAFEMTVVLNNAVQDETAVVNKTMTDDQISEVLAEVKTNPKRKSDVKRDVKRFKGIKLDVKSTENNENTTANTTVHKNYKPLDKITDKTGTPTLHRSLQASPSSFNDSYKDFVDQSFKNSISDCSTPKKSKKVVMKTKIGQFKVRPSLSPKESTPTPMKTLQLSFKPDLEYEVKEQENDCNILILKI